LALANKKGGNRRRVVSVFVGSLLATAGWHAACAKGEISALIAQVHWGETSQELLRHFGGAAVQLPRGFDFGDSYADVVLTKETLGGVRL